MRRHHSTRPESDADSDTDPDSGDGSAAVMKCISCKEEYKTRDAGTCKECYEEASETEEELKREIDDLKAKIAFLRFWSPVDHVSSVIGLRSSASVAVGPCFTDVELVAYDDGVAGPPVPAHKAVLVSRSPVFKAMMENNMEESRSGTIKISDVSYDALRTFVNYLYTAEACLDEQMAWDLLVLAEKYQVKHLKNYCEKFLVTRLTWENSLMSYAFAHHHNARIVLDSALALILDNMNRLTKREEYTELLEKDPRVVVEIFEAYLSKQVNTAAATTHKDLAGKS